MLGENPPPTTVIEIQLGPNFQALLGGESPVGADETLQPGMEVPDFVPEEWPEPPAPDPFA